MLHDLTHGIDSFIGERGVRLSGGQQQRVTIARPFNTYGPRQSARVVNPTVITQIAAGKKQIHLGDVSPTRDFNYVLDTCQGFVDLAQSDDTPKLPKCSACAVTTPKFTA